MKVKILRLIWIMIVTGMVMNSCVPRVDEYSIYDTSTGRRVSVNRMASQLAEYDIVIFGEHHGNDIIHRLQAELLPYYLRHAGEIAVSMEMFERDTQRYLDNYLEGIIDEEEFIELSRVWPNYRTDYKPIIEFARKERLPVIASNVPRRYAAGVNRFGLRYLDEIPETERVFLADEVIITEDAYKENFFRTMKSLSHLDIADSYELDQRLENLYAAQSLKDDTMAESIVNFRQRFPEVKIIHFNGDFHSRYRLGVVTKIEKRHPDLRIATISPHIVDADLRFRYEQDFRNIADFIIVLPTEDDYYKE